LSQVMPRFAQSPKLSPEEEEALLKTLRIQREQKARALVQIEAQNVARLKLAEVAIDKVPEDAAPLVSKDKKNFPSGTEKVAVIAITLNAVLLSACKAAEAPVDEGPKGKGKAKGKAKAATKPKVGPPAKVERLPPPTGDAAAEAIVKHKPTLERVLNVKDKKSGELQVKESQEARQAMLAAFEAWLTTEYNEPVLPEAPKLLAALSSEGLLDGEILSEYWAKVLSTHSSDCEEQIKTEAECKEAEAQVGNANESLKQAQKEDGEMAQQVKWAAAEVQNARTGNQPSPEELAREKAANISDKKMRDYKLVALKKVEVCHKEQVAALNAFEAAKKAVTDQASGMRSIGLMRTYGKPFFEPPVADTTKTAD